MVLVQSGAAGFDTVHAMLSLWYATTGEAVPKPVYDHCPGSTLTSAPEEKCRPA